MTTTMTTMMTTTTAVTARPGPEEETSALVSEGRRLLALVALSAVAVPLMLLELWIGVGGWVAWVLGAFVVVALLLAPHVLTMRVEARRRGLLDQAPVVRASALGGLVGGLIGLMFRPEHYPTGGFFAATVLVVAYYMFSRWFALLVRTGSSQSVRKLLELQPASVRLVRDGEEHEVLLQAVQVGDLVRIRPGERVPVDGRVASGRSAVDQSLVTGESMPEEKLEGDEVIGGSINGSGTLLVEVIRVGEDTFLQQVIRSIEDARELKPRVLDLVGRVLRVYIPAVLWLAVLAAVFWLVVPAVLGDGPDLNRAVFATLSVLIIAYPCAVGLAAPLALVRGAGEAAEHGIILRTGEAFQAFPSVDRIVFDKTGTLTEGKFTVREVEALGDRTELLALAAAVEGSSEHPIGAAIVAAGREQGVAPAAVQEFEAISGHGVRATISGATVLVGRPAFVAEHGGHLGQLTERVAALEEAGRTVVAVSRDGEPLGLIALGDQIRPEARAVVEEIKRQGIMPVLLTGDNRRAAQRVARELGIEDVRAEVLPDGKAEIVRDLQRHGHRVAMVGDGINDAPALTQADVGIAMGSGTDIAIESADVVIVGNRLEAVLMARDIGRRSYRRLQQNVAFAFLFNAIGVPLAATGLLYPIWAMVVMVVSVTAVFANSMWGKWSLVFLTTRDIAKRQVSQPSPTIDA
ncbi:MAG: heavy metal translocating P-type ATPase [Chloroflexi bacterium]|nr:heavy metal translocating P-type ATPase [Chloroflexota bacterium]